MHLVMMSALPMMSVLPVLGGGLICAVLRRSQMSLFLLAVSMLSQAVQNGASLKLTGMSSSKVRAFTSSLSSSRSTLVFDIGLNDGTDTSNFLSRGHSVVAVDANPQWAKRARSRFAKEISENRLLVINVGLTGSNQTTTAGTGGMPFFISRTNTRSSFDYDKATKHGPPIHTIHVPVIPCSTLFAAFPEAFFVKIDIEELDHVCVRAVAMMPRDQQPLYIAWENAFKRSTVNVMNKWPIFDLELVMGLARNGFPHVKMSRGFTGTSFGPYLPDQIIDCYVNTSGWRTVPQFVHDGVSCHGDVLWHEPDYFDFSMRHEKVHTALSR